MTNAGSVKVGVQACRGVGVLTAAPKLVNMPITQHSNEVVKVVKVVKVGEVGNDV